MSSCLIGHSGFIGGNLARQTHFDDLFRSTDIAEVRGRSYDLLVCSGVTAVKWWANKNAEEDRARIDSLLAHLATVQARRVVVISTVDVYPQSAGVDETFDCHAVPNHAYGINRLYFEDEMLRLYPDAAIVRVGGVFGPGLKKNILYDLLHDNGLDAINPLSSFQFYNVGGIWSDIQRMSAANLKLVNFVTEPVLVQTIVDRIFPGKSVGASPAPAAHYDIRSLHAAAMGASGPYLATQQQVLSALSHFAAAESHA